MLNPTRLLDEIFDASTMPDDPLAVALAKQYDFACSVHDEWRQFEAAHRLAQAKEFSRLHTN
jgi:hypothetical protein